MEEYCLRTQDVFCVKVVLFNVTDLFLWEIVGRLDLLNTQNTTNNLICIKFWTFVINPTIIKQHSLSWYKSHLSRCEIFYLPVGSCETRAQLQHWRLRMICCMVMFITRQSSDYGITKFTVLITDKDEQTLSLTEQSFALVWSFSLIVVTAWCGCCREAITWVWQPAWDRDSTCFSMCAYFKVNLNMIHV